MVAVELLKLLTECLVDLACVGDLPKVSIALPALGYDLELVHPSLRLAGR
jgi:hypothetical protein